MVIKLETMTIEAHVCCCTVTAMLAFRSGSPLAGLDIVLGFAGGTNSQIPLANKSRFVV